MTVKQLIKKLEALPQDLDVMLMQTDDENAYNTVETCEVRPITFGSEGVPRKEWATVDCVVITDEL